MTSTRSPIALSFPWILGAIACGGGNGGPPTAGSVQPPGTTEISNAGRGSESSGASPASAGQASTVTAVGQGGGTATSNPPLTSGGISATSNSAITGGSGTGIRSSSVGIGQGAGGRRDTSQPTTSTASNSGGLPAAGGKPTAAGRTGAGNASSVGGATVSGGTSAMGSGGKATAGAATSTSNPSGGNCQPSTCGSHKWACWKVPTPVSESLPNPQNYTDLGDGTIRDNVTCLVWEKAPPTTKTVWQGQFDRCQALADSAFAGASDWRLPTRMEMASITDVTLGSTGFPKIFTTPGSYYATASYWYETITFTSNNPQMVWAYGTNGFTSNSLALNPTDISKNGFLSRCVRGNGTGEEYNELAREPSNHYTLSNGEVTDNYTGLVWQQGFSPSLVDHAGAIAYCTSLSLNGHSGWRVPALNELASTVNEAKVGGAIVETAFPNNPNGCKDPKYWFWAAEASGASNFWGLSYCDGFTGPNVGESGAWNYFPTANVRCVRNGP